MSLRIATLVLLVTALTGADIALADERGDPHAGHHAPAQSRPGHRITPGPTPEVTLLDHHGQQVRFPEVLRGDSIVVIDFIYTSCTTVCPVMSTFMAQLRDRLTDQPPGAVRLISISLDPAHDTVPVLARYAKRYGAGPRWSFVTGDKPKVDAVLKSLGTYTADFRSHPPTVLVGDLRSGHWMRFNGLPSPRKLASQIDELLETRSAQRKANP